MRNWTPEERAKQAALCRRHRPWTKSTGPRSETGKATASQNARKHALGRRELREFSAVLRLQRNFLRAFMETMPHPPPLTTAERTDKTDPSTVIARSVSDKAIQPSPAPKMDCFSNARNDDPGNSANFSCKKQALACNLNPHEQEEKQQQPDVGRAVRGPARRHHAAD